MKCFLTPVFSLFIFFAFSQSDTGKIYNCKEFKRGFYKTYEEFINNSPTITSDFEIIKQFLSKRDSNAISIDLKLNEDEKKPTSIFGFSDGIAVYISYDNGIYKNRYWKLEHVGKNSFFTFSYNRFSRSSNPSAPIAISRIILLGPASIIPSPFPPLLKSFNYRLMVITSKGKVKYPDAAFVRKQLASQPDFLKDFKEEWKPYEKFDYANADETESEESYRDKMEIVKKYLIKLDERLK